MTFDFIEQAQEALEQGNHSYVLIVGCPGERRTTMASRLEPEELEMLQSWIDSGFWNEMLANHILRNS